VSSPRSQSSWAGNKNTHEFMIYHLCYMFSLCALAIRNAIIKGLRTFRALSPRSIDALPADLLYYLPSISKISIFLYGAAYIDARNRNELTKESGNEGVGGETEVANAISDEEWQKAMESEETVVEIVKGNDVEEPPLIILHGILPSF
jgi:hypothetical protein